MKTIGLFIMLGVIAAIGTALPARAQQVPSVVGLQPFTSETNYMSLPGYLRWQYFLEANVWLSRNEAVALVNQQLRVAAAP